MNSNPLNLGMIGVTNFGKVRRTRLREAGLFRLVAVGDRDPGRLATAAAGQPVGVWLLSRMTNWDRAELAQVFGMVLLLVLAVKLWWRPPPRPRWHPAWGIGTLFASGTISGMSGMGGPLTLLGAVPGNWIARRLSPAQSRHAVTAILLIVALYAISQPILLKPLLGK